MNIFHGSFKSLQRFKFTSNIYAKSVKVSPLIFTSTGDKLIKKEYTDRLINCFTNVEKEVVFDGIGHNDYWLEDRLFDEIYDYLKIIRLD